MTILQISTANTFGQWLTATQDIIDKSNQYESRTNLVFSSANTIFVTANNISNTSNSINTSYTNIQIYVNTAFSLANTAANTANYASTTANSANITAYTAWAAANSATANLMTLSAFAQSNSAYGKANSANVLAQVAFNKANSANVLAQAAYDNSNTDFTGITISTGTSGNSSYISVVTVAANGRISAISNTQIGIAASQITSGTVNTAQGGTGLTVPGTSGNVLVSNGTSWISTIASGGFTSVQVISANTTALAGVMYVMTANLVLTLPASPSSRDLIGVSNQSGYPNCNIARNGKKIMNLTEDMKIDTTDAGFTLIYSDISYGWVII
jgi:hypothetical protein